MNMDNFYEQADAYLDGLLRGQELADFEQLLSENKELAEHVAFAQLTKSAVAHRENIALKALLHHLGQTTPIEPRFDDDDLLKEPTFWKRLTNTKHRYFWLIGSVLVLLISVTVVYWVMKPSKPLPPAVQSYFDFTPEPIPVGGTDTTKPASRGIYAFQLGQYNQAIYALKEALVNESNNYTLHYVLGVCLLKEKRYAEAEISFKNVLKASPNDYEDNSRYYLSLTLLQENKVEEATDSLKRVISGPFESKAKDLLKALEGEK